MLTETEAGALPRLTLPNRQPARNAWSLDWTVSHLNHGSYGAVPTQVQEAQNKLRQEMLDSPSKWFMELPERMESARECIASFLGTTSSRLAFISNASAGASVVFNSLRLPSGGEILVTDHGYGAVVMGAERMARKQGLNVRTVHIPLSAGRQEAAARIASEISDRTVLVILDQITSATARFMPVAETVRVAKSVGARVLVDGAHGPGIVEAPAGEGADAPDYWIGNLHKWCCAPPGAAVLDVAPDSAGLSLSPLIDSWGATEHYPNSFDVQGTLDTTSALVAPYAVQLLDELIGWQQLRHYQARLVDYAQEVVSDAFEKATGETHGVNVGMSVAQMRLVRLPSILMIDGAHALRDRILAQYRIAVAITEFNGEGFLRLSSHAYSSAEEYEIFAEKVVPDLIAEYRGKPER